MNEVKTQMKTLLSEDNNYLEGFAAEDDDDDIDESEDENENAMSGRGKQGH